MSQAYTKQFDHLPKELVTDAVVFPPFAKGSLPPLMLYSQNAAWDTGSEQTIISPYVAEALELKSIAHTNIS